MRRFCELDDNGARVRHADRVANDHELLLSDAGSTFDGAASLKAPQITRGPPRQTADVLTGMLPVEIHRPADTVTSSDVQVHASDARGVAQALAANTIANDPRAHSWHIGRCMRAVSQYCRRGHIAGSDQLVCVLLVSCLCCQDTGRCARPAGPAHRLADLIAGCTRFREAVAHINNRASSPAEPVHCHHRQYECKHSKRRTEHWLDGYPPPRFEELVLWSVRAFELLSLVWVYSPFTSIVLNIAVSSTITTAISLSDYR